MNHQALNLIVRAATRADVAVIVRMLADDPLGQTRERYEQPLPQTYLDAYARIEADPNNYLVVAETEGTIVGTLQLTLIPGLSFGGGTRAQIEAVRVDRRYRGQGIGQHLIEWAIEQAQAHACCMVQLTTNASRTAAQHFYERLGFVPSHIGMKLKLD